MGQPDYFDEGALVAVLTTQPLDQTLDYKAPEGGVMRGAFVEVPLGPRKVLGVVWGAGVGGFNLSRARSIVRVLDVDAEPERAEDVPLDAYDVLLDVLVLLREVLEVVERRVVVGVFGGGVVYLCGE